MICQPCQFAGEANSHENYTTAELLHRDCKGCDCQHKTGELVNREKIDAKAS